MDAGGAEEEGRAARVAELSRGGPSEPMVHSGLEGDDGGEPDQLSVPYALDDSTESVEDITRVPASWVLKGDVGRNLIEAVLRRVDARGSDVRLDLGTLYRPSQTLHPGGGGFAGRAAHGEGAAGAA